MPGRAPPFALQERDLFYSCATKTQRHESSCNWPLTIDVLHDFVANCLCSLLRDFEPIADLSNRLDKGGVARVSEAYPCRADPASETYQTATNTALPEAQAKHSPYHTEMQSENSCLYGLSDVGSIIIL